MKLEIILLVLVLRHAKSEGNNMWSDVANHHPTWRVLDSFECGYGAADRIIGGYNAALGQFPWIARLGYLDPYASELDWMCGGALISDRHIVTAAHCVQTPGDEYKLTSIRLGEHNTQTNPDCQLSVCAPPAQNRAVKTIRSYPGFNSPAFHNDIAVVEVDPPLELNDYVSPICLPHREQLEEPLRIGEFLTVAGWGTMNMSTEDRAQILQVVSLPVVRPEQCDTFGKGFKLAQSEICAGAQHNKDACGGDSGGPLMKVFDTPEGPKNFLVGVVSFGPNICGIKKPGVYTSVPHFLKWILDSIA